MKAFNGMPPTYIWIQIYGSVASQDSIRTVLHSAFSGTVQTHFGTARMTPMSY